MPTKKHTEIEFMTWVAPSNVMGGFNERIAPPRDGQDDLPATYPVDKGLPSDRMLAMIATEIPQKMDMSDWESL